MFNWIIQHSPLLYFTQSLWRDEAYSILLAQRPITEIFQKLTFETPLYYILLHFWLKLFGSSEIAARSLSFVGLSLATVVVIVWAEKMFDKHWLSWFLPLFFIFNPMLLYYGFEIRTYGWYIFFTTLSLYAYTQKNWKLYTAATTLGFYTHAYMLIVPFTQMIHYLVTSSLLHKIQKNPWKFLKDPMMQSLAAFSLLASPWLMRIIVDAGRLKESWYYPVDFHLIQSVLGNMFVGYEGTPWYLWTYTAVLSFVLSVFFFASIRFSKHKNIPLLFAILVFVPLSLVIGISFIKPLFVNRYLIPVTIGEIFLIVIAIHQFKNPSMQKLFAFLWFMGILTVNVWYPSKHAKFPIRDTFIQVNAIRRDGDIVVAASPLMFFETIYYSANKSGIYLYNPSGVPFPWYVGDSIVSANQQIREFPPYPTRAIFVKEDGSYEIAFTTALPK